GACPRQPWTEALPPFPHQRDPRRRPSERWRRGHSSSQCAFLLALLEQKLERRRLPLEGSAQSTDELPGHGLQNYTPALLEEGNRGSFLDPEPPTQPHRNHELSLGGDDTGLSLHASPTLSCLSYLDEFGKSKKKYPTIPGQRRESVVEGRASPATCRGTACRPLIAMQLTPQADLRG